MSDLFTVGGVEFDCVRVDFPRLHWRLKIVETGFVFEAGCFKSQSRPILRADVEYGFERAKTTEEWRRRLGL